MSSVVVRHGKLDFVLDTGDQVAVTFGGVPRVGRVLTSTPGETTVIFESPVLEAADDDTQLMAIASERLRAGLERVGSITSQTVRVEDEGRCNACTGGSYETVTLVELRSIAFRLCDECRKTLWEQLASEEPEELDQVHERGYQMGYADAVIDAAGGGLDHEILDAESRRRAGEASADVLKAPRLVDGRVMRGDAEVEPKCPICGTGISCPCGVGIGT